MVSAGKVDADGIKALIAQLDKPATDTIQELRVMPLEFLDATETVDILEEYLRKPGGTRSRTGSELVGDIRLQPSVTMNAIVASGSAAELDRIQSIIQGMDHEVVGGNAPRIVKLAHGSASQLASTLTAMFTEPARQQSRGRAASPEMIPLIMADDSTNSLLVRARTVDYNLIADMVKTLDVETQLTGMEVIPLSRGVDVEKLARSIEQTINMGEQAKARQQPGYRPRSVSIGVEDRIPALMVGGSPELLPSVRQLVEQLQSLKGTTAQPQRAMVIPLTNVQGADVKRILDQLIEKQTGKNPNAR